MSKMFYLCFLHENKIKDYEEQINSSPANKYTFY